MLINRSVPSACAPNQAHWRPACASAAVGAWQQTLRCCSRSECHVDRGCGGNAKGVAQKRVVLHPTPRREDCSLSVDVQVWRHRLCATCPLVSVALVAVTSAAPAFGHGHNHPRRAAEAAFGAVEAPQFVRVGPNGYWITTTWGCYTDNGQRRIQDCEGGTGGGS